ncbi:uncharacterized protein N7483_008650 [Penicillium malachiteum]|uniref:uncharacterized protein n=1 Tax=Penicillium malachiteum TaxID=1324776 RepID=UPI002546C86E|nr:uncharacterized protein N7483_008650 [Penicillium malachiteum]KAJ5720716.1 hypothetical protein N7483_008650 [Penicillium malachiteum]
MDLQFNYLENVLNANRGEIAVRLIRACAAVGIKCVSVYTEADSNSEHASLADEGVLLSGDNVKGYLDADNLIEICKAHNVDAVIPGYGFLSEDVNFAQKVQNNGIIFIGPSCESILEMGQKHRARAESVGVPVVPGSPLLQTEQEAIEAAKRIAFLIRLKATGGGGGMGLQVYNEESDIQNAFAMVKGRGESLFGNTGVFMEKYFPSSRHVEVQVFGNGQDVVHFGERECSIQRQHQKIIEECPSPYVHQQPDLRKRITECAFLVDDSTGDFFFLEMNTRLQVEHGITELCYDVDLVALMLSQADWEKSGATGIPSEYLRGLQNDEPKGAAIECRIYAEVPHKNFAPSSGLLQAVTWPQGSGIRVDSWIKAGQNMSPHYDPLLAKVMVHSESRETAMTKMLETLATCVLQGPANNLQYLGAIVASDGCQRALTNYIRNPFQVGSTFDTVFPEVVYLAFKEGQQNGFEEQLPIEQKLHSEWAEEVNSKAASGVELAKALLDSTPGAINIESPLNANVWKIEVKVGDVLRKDQIVCILEAMKMEIAVKVPTEAVGTKVSALAVSPGSMLAPGEALVIAVC